MDLNELKKKMEGAQLTQADVYKKHGLNRHTFSSYYNGKRPFPKTTLSLLFYWFRVKNLLALLAYFVNDKMLTGNISLEDREIIKEANKEILKGD